ncbi:MAG: energy transducer TonB [Gammaproteobacteria bacterium]
MTIALVLSGLVHALFMFDSFNNELFIQFTETQSNSLYLELSKQMAVSSSQQKDSAIVDDYEKLLATQHIIAEQKKLNQAEKQQKSKEQAQAEQLSNSAKDEQQQKKQLSKPVVNHDALLQLVYQAISEHKRYPYMARRLGQQGKVSLNFVMHPDGQVTDVVVIESSRYSVLDRAAEQAVVAISPFAKAAEYLSYEKVFDIAVDFRLN